MTITYHVLYSDGESAERRTLSNIDFDEVDEVELMNGWRVVTVVNPDGVSIDWTDNYEADSKEDKAISKAAQAVIAKFEGEL